MKWLLRMVRLGLVVVSVSLLTVVTTGYVVHSYIQSLLSSYNLPIVSQTPSVGSVLKGMLGMESEGKTSTAKKGEPAEQGAGRTEGTAEAPEDTSQTADGHDAGSEPEDSTDSGEAPEGAVPVMGGIAGESAGAGQDQQVLVTPEDLVAKKDELSSTEKEEVFATLMTKLPEQDMQRMSEVMEGGLTETEMIEIEQMLSKHLTKEEYAKIIQTLKK